MANFNQILDSNAKASHKTEKPSIRSIEVHIGEDGGHGVEHHFHNGPSKMVQHFGAGEGKAVLAHIKEHAGLNEEGAEGAAY